MKSSIKKMPYEVTVVPTRMEDEVENVEYLEDCVTDDIEGDSENSALHRPIAVDAVFKDTFYPNAVQCLLTLYRHKYDQEMNDPHKVHALYKRIWEDISKDMRESYFQFDPDQVKHKFTLLRKQYFSVSSKGEAAKFEYFHYFHDMYSDKIISEILNGDSTSCSSERKDIQCSYRDDILFGDVETQEIMHNEKQTDDIANKEHEFFNMVERELKAMGDGSRKAKFKTEPTHDENLQKRERKDSNEGDILTCHPSKRPCEQTQSKLNIKDGNDDKSDMTLADYNEAQQRRHEEKMNLFRQNLLLQERIIEVQSKLLEQIKRV